MYNNNSDNNNSNNNNSINNDIRQIFSGGDDISLLSSSPSSSPNVSGRFLKATKSKRKFSMRQQILPMVAMLCLASIVISLVIISRNYSANNMPGNQSPFVVVTDNDLLQVALASRANLLKVHQGAITKLDFSVMVLNPVGSWSLATYNGQILSNASRCVYLPFLAAAVNWCLNQGEDPHCLQMATEPMMQDYSSIHAGIVVDTITHAPNAFYKQSNDTGFAEWLENRKYVQNFLETNNLLGNQTVINKIYPSNSGSGPSYGELLAQNIMGPNLMDPYHSSLLMLYLVYGGIIPEGTAYLTDLLSEQTFSSSTSFGFGLPPGSVLHSVLGTSTTDVNEIAHIILPNGRQLIMSAYSDGYQNFGNPPYQSSILGIFAENLILGMNLTNGNPISIIMDAASAVVSPQGGWQMANSIQAYNHSYYWMAGGNTTPYSVIWNVPKINVTGLYEVCVWFPGATNQTTNAIYTVQTGTGNDNHQYTINQQHYGARWILLDSFFFVQNNTPIIHISNTGVKAGQVVVADTVKLTMWPTTDNIPGLANNYVNNIENYNYD